MVSSEEAKILLKLARDSINSWFTREEIDLEKHKKRFGVKQGVFVTLKINNQLRGCIGFPEPVLPLYKAVFEAARAAAFSDPRFLPLTEQECKKAKIELSVLTVPEEIKVNAQNDLLKKIIIGEDGLIVKKGFFSGLLLPQVFTEYKCNPEQALCMTCQKAGLPANAWKDSSCRFWKFQAEIFEEKNYKKLINIKSFSSLNCSCQMK